MIIQPNSLLRNKLNSLCNDISKIEEKQNLEKIMAVFFQGNAEELKEAVQKVGGCMINNIGNPSAPTYLAIFQLMNEHYINALKRMDDLALLAHRAAISKFPIVTTPPPVTWITPIHLEEENGRTILSHDIAQSNSSTTTSHPTRTSRNDLRAK